MCEFLCYRYVIQPSSMVAIPSRCNRKPARRRSWSSARDAANLLLGKRNRSQSVNPDLSSQTIHEICTDRSPLSNMTDSPNEHNELTVETVARKVSNKIFITEKVDESDVPKNETTA